MNTEKNVQEIPIEDIIPNRFQPRLAFNEEGLNELSESIKEHGIIQPLVVRKLGDKYEIIAGERRYKAATQAGLTKVPVILSDLDDNKSAEVALVENIQRRNLTSIEEAKSYKNLLDRGYLTQEQLASKMGVSQSSIANKLRLLNLDEEVQDALLNEKISERHARALLSLEDKEEQKKWLKRIINERMTVRQLDMELKKLKDQNGEEDAGIPLVEINPNIDDILNNAEDINTVRAPHDVASMLMPDKSMKIEEPTPVSEIKKEPETPQIPNKFFNFLEDEEANMDIGTEEDIFTSFVPPITETIDNQETEDNKINEESFEADKVFEEPIINNVETLDDLDDLDDLDNSVKSIESSDLVLPASINQEVEENSIIENQTVTEDSNIEKQQTEIPEFEPFKPMFFNEEPTPIMEETPIIEENNVIEEVKQVQEEKIIDPMDSVIKLEPDYEEKQEEAAGTDLKSAINIIRDTVDDLTKKGFLIETEEADLDDLYHITIKINKE